MHGDKSEIENSEIGWTGAQPNADEVREPAPVVFVQDEVQPCSATARQMDSSVAWVIVVGHGRHIWELGRDVRFISFQFIVNALRQYNTNIIVA
jgi:hypothetical protein